MHSHCRNYNNSIFKARTSTYACAELLLVDLDNLFGWQALGFVQNFYEYEKAHDEVRPSCLNNSRGSSSTQQAPEVAGEERHRV